MSTWNIFPAILCPVATERDETNIESTEGSMTIEVVVATYC